jgi:hypothetical protein
MHNDLQIVQARQERLVHLNLFFKEELKTRSDESVGAAVCDLDQELDLAIDKCRVPGLKKWLDKLPEPYPEHFSNRVLHMKVSQIIGSNIRKRINRGFVQTVSEFVS